MICAQTASFKIIILYFNLAWNRIVGINHNLQFLLFQILLLFFF